MSENKKNINRKHSEYIRYLDGEMSGAERNSFERNLQKDPFAEEAMDGFSSISANQAEKDLAKLERLIGARTKKKQRYIYYRIAASVAVLMVISTLYIVIDRNKSVQKLTLTEIKQNALEIIENEPLREPALRRNTPSEDVAAKSRIVKEESKTEKPEEVKDELLREDIAKVEKDATSTNTVSSQAITGQGAGRDLRALKVAAAPEKAKNLSVFHARGKILSSEDNLPVPGANVIIKGTTTGVVTDTGGNFDITLSDKSDKKLVVNYIGMETREFDAKPDSSVNIKINPSSESLSEVVVVGYGVAKDALQDEAEEGYIPPQPIKGRSYFDNYIKENQRRPDILTEGQRVVVVVNFLVLTDGTIDSVKIIRSPSRQFSDEAIRLIKSGPEWKPAIKDGKTIDDDVRIRIVFK